MPLVLYEVASELGAAGAELAAFRYSGGELTLAALREAFPEAGSFHFRARTQHPADPQALAWMDLVDSDEVVPRGPDGGPPQIRALPIMFDEEDDDEGDHRGEGGDWDAAGTTAASFASPGSTGAGASRAGDDPAKAWGLGQVDEVADPQPIAGTGAASADGEDDMDAFFAGTGPAQSGAATPEPRTAHSSSEDDDDDSEDDDDSSSDDSGSGDSGSEAGRGAGAGWDEAAAASDAAAAAAAAATRGATAAASEGSEGQATKSSSLFGSALGRSAFGASVGKSAFGASVSSFLKKSAKAAISLASGAEALPSTQQRGALNHLLREMQGRFEDDNKEHVALLKACWKTAFPAEAFKRRGAQWQLVGFATSDPASDPALGQTGVLGLRCLAYHMDHAVNSLDDCSAPLASTMGQAVVELGRLFELPDRAFESSPRAYWGLFDAGIGSFFELASIAASLADKDVRAGARQGAAVSAAVDKVRGILQQAPRNIDAFYQAGKSMGIL